MISSYFGDRMRSFALTGCAIVLAAAAVLIPRPACAEPLVVLEARGTGSTAGETVDSSSRLTLERGEHLRLIGQNGNQYCLDGPYNGPAEPTPGRSSGFHRFVSLLLGARLQDRADRLTDCMR